MLAHAKQRQGKYGLYFETGQGADATNGAAAGFDMVIHESRKYGFARALKAKMAAARKSAGRSGDAWVHLNDVAGFIGPEVFRTKEQLVRCCLEDIVMGKLHGLPIGLDICSTLHMSVGLDDLDWCIDQIMPANPAYLMALPTKNDPMLSYLTTAFQDHVRIRSKFKFKVNDAMWSFFQRLGVVQADGSPGPHFGDPTWVFMEFRRALKDTRSDAQLREVAVQKLKEVRARGVWIAEGHAAKPWDMEPKLEKYIRTLVDDGKRMIYTALPNQYEKQVGPAIKISTESANRDDYILHPPSGEKLGSAAVQALEQLRGRQGSDFNVQIMISDGLNANAITDKGHVDAYLPKLRQALASAGLKAAPETIVCTSGRVRAGYRAGEVLFGTRANQQEKCAMLHIIGERPGSEHHSFSVYLSAPTVSVWATQGKLDHDVTKVVANIADTALVPDIAVAETVTLLKQLMAA
jgi:ethanolamine ammonia-lyase large subunit